MDRAYKPGAINGASASGGAPRIDDGNARPFKIARVARNDRQAVAEGGRGDDEIRLGEGVPSLATFLERQPPLELTSSLTGSTRRSTIEPKAAQQAGARRFDDPVALWLAE